MDSKAKFDFFVHSTWNRLKNKTQKYRKKPTESVRVFGGRFPSVEITEEESVHYTEFIPNVVYKSVQFLQENGMNTEGIFRIGGQHSEIKALRDKFERNAVDNLDKNLHSVNTVASLLKLYLREMPEPLLSYELYECFKAIGDIEDDDTRKESICAIISILPKYNYECAGFLLRFLKKVSSNSSINKMDSRNLALIFAPNILKSEDNDHVASLADTPKLTVIVEFMINNAEFIFPEYESAGNQKTEDDKQKESQEIYNCKNSHPIENKNSSNPIPPPKPRRNKQSIMQQ